MKAVDSNCRICQHSEMIRKGTFRTYLLLFLLIMAYGGTIPGAFGEPDASIQETEDGYYSDRFIFRGSDVDDLLLILLNFNRGRREEGHYGEFFGAVFYKNKWSFLEGNDRFLYPPVDLQTIQPSYFARAEGSPISGFKLRYDGGDFTIKLSSGPVRPLYVSDDGPNLKKKVGVAEAVATLHGNEFWGELIHEPVVWVGFNGLKRYKGLYKEYQGFYLATATGRQIYFHQNKADRARFLKQNHFSETLQAEGGVIQSDNEIIHTFKSPIPVTILKRVTPPFAFYTVPQRWRIEASPVGTFFIWSREKISKNWILGGYYLMAIEGIMKNESGEERVWGFSEYFP